VGSLPVALGLGFCLGLRHAVDPDHVAAVAALAGGGRNSSAALVSSMAWGLGHSTTFLGCGLCVVALDLVPPPAFERSVAFVVAGTLVVIGLIAILRALRERAAPRHVEGSRLLRRRSFAVGSVHGLAGSHGIALLALATIRSAEAALAYLVLFCIGTLVGMLGIALLLSRSLAWAESSGHQVTTAIGLLAGFSSIWVGGTILIETLSLAG
jgi:nickel/cobalt exporter